MANSIPPYSAFTLSESQLQRIAEINKVRKIRNYIREHGEEPDAATLNSFLTLSNNEIEMAKVGLYVNSFYKEDSNVPFINNDEDEEYFVGAKYIFSMPIISDSGSKLWFKEKEMAWDGEKKEWYVDWLFKNPLIYEYYVEGRKNVIGCWSVGLGPNANELYGGVNINFLRHVVNSGHFNSGDILEYGTFVYVRREGSDVPIWGNSSFVLKSVDKEFSTWARISLQYYDKKIHDAVSIPLPNELELADELFLEAGPTIDFLSLGLQNNALTLKITGDNPIYFHTDYASVCWPTEPEPEIIETGSTVTGDTEFSGDTGTTAETSGETVNPYAPNPDWLELPVMDDENLIYQTHYMVVGSTRHRNYTYAYNVANRISKWVAYPLNKNLIGNGARTVTWANDPSLPVNVQANIVDGAYVRTGSTQYDRDQLIPNASRRVNVNANQQTYYSTNIIPTPSSINQNEKATIEDKVRQLAGVSNMCYVVTGTIFNENSSKVYDRSNNEVTAPDYIYKVVLSELPGSTYSWQVYCAVIDCATAEVSYMSISELEALTGMTFYPNLRDKVGESLYNQIKSLPSEGRI